MTATEVFHLIRETACRLGGDSSLCEYGCQNAQFWLRVGYDAETVLRIVTADLEQRVERG